MTQLNWQSPIGQTNDITQSNYHSEARSLSAERWAMGENLGLIDASAWGRILLQGEISTSLLNKSDLSFATEPGAGVWGPGYDSFRLRGDQTIIITQPNSTDKMMEKLSRMADTADSLITVTDMSDGLFQLRLAGSRSAELLSRLCGLNFQSDTFGNWQVRQTSVAKTSQMILRHDIPLMDEAISIPSYSVIGGRSLAAYLWDTMIQAGYDLNVKAVSWTVFEDHPSST